MRTTHRLSLPLLAMLLTTPAGADDHCSVPMDQWQSRQAVQEMIEARGWTTRHIKIDESRLQIDNAVETRFVRLDRVP